MYVLCFPERKTETRMIRCMCGVSLKDRDEDDQGDVWCFPERQMRMIRWMCGFSLKERQRLG